MSIKYEWDYETWDNDNEIEDHNHRDVLSEFTAADKTDHLVLVRDNEDNGDRSWAYVENGKLPDFFKDAYDRDTFKVPARFHNELKRFLTNPL